MKMLGLLAISLVLCGCSDTITGVEHLQVAPNTVKCDSYYSGAEMGNCLVVRLEEKSGFSPWSIIGESSIAGFAYEPGYFYDLSINTSCNRFALGEFPEVTRKLGSVNSKTVSTEEFQPFRDKYYLYGYC